MELKAYFGFMILMGLNKLPGLVDYWKVDPIYHYAPIAGRIPRDRFFEISRYLHFADNTQLLPPTDPGYDKLGKVRPIIDHLKVCHCMYRGSCSGNIFAISPNIQFLITHFVSFSPFPKARFQLLYKPTRNNAVDEAMIPFKGRSGIKQYMPKKPVKRGIKVWVRADSDNGYFCDFDVYIGAGTSPEKGLGARVVKALTQSLAGKNHHIFCDNFFSGIELFADLEKDGIYACGTLRANRLHFPKDLKPTAKKGLKNRGDSETRQAGNLVVTV